MLAPTFGCGGAGFFFKKNMSEEKQQSIFFEKIR
jgi:hypothetical protein